MGCSTSTLDDETHASEQNTESSQQNGKTNQNGKKSNWNDKLQPPPDIDVLEYGHKDSQGNKFIKNDQL